MIDLADFLLARFSEDEAVAQLANGRVAWLTLLDFEGSMRYATVAHQHHGADAWTTDGRIVESSSVDVFYDSRRVLAECEAKRRIVEDLTDTRFPALRIDPAVAQHLLRLLALPYADHPDYREAWKL